jgi:hypothetical protein
MCLLQKRKISKIDRDRWRGMSGLGLKTFVMGHALCCISWLTVVLTDIVI